MKNRNRRLKIFYRYLKFFVPLVIVMTIYSCQQMRILPPLKDIKEVLHNEPVQKPIAAEPFDFDYAGETYIIEPLRFYEIWGLVVTHNNINSITDSYHNSKSVDVKDLCVVWGNNVMSEIYKAPTYWSAPWTCNFQIDDPVAYQQFDMTALSNTHILSHRENIRDVLHDVTVGDQIRMKGMLIDYANKKTPQYNRPSSLIRTDTGNGACEVMFVDEFEIVHLNQPLWKQIHYLMKYLSLLGVLLIPALWLFFIYSEQQYVNEELRAGKERMARRSRRSKRLGKT